MKSNTFLTQTDIFLFDELRSTFWAYRSNFGTELGTTLKLKLTNLVQIMTHSDYESAIVFVETLTLDRIQEEIDHKLDNIYERIEMGYYLDGNSGRV